MMQFSKLHWPTPEQFKASCLAAGRVHLQTLRVDLIAGLTVAMVAIPQAMAYAALAGISPVYGLYTAIAPAIVASLFGSSRYLSTGPTNGTALVTAAVLLPLAAHPDYAQYVFALAILSGLLKLVLGICRLGVIMRFVANSVLTGFLAGAAMLIIIHQLGNLLELRTAPGLETPVLVWRLVQQLPDLNPYALITGITSIVTLLIVQHLNRRLPAALIAVGFAAALVQVAGWHQAGVRLVVDVGSLADIGLSFHLPAIDLAHADTLVAGAIAVTLYSLVEAMSVARALSFAAGQHVDASREFIGQGLASLAGGFLRSMPSSGSLSRSAINYASGAKTRIAGITAGFVVLIAVYVGRDWIGLIPLSSLAGIVIVYAWGMVDRKHAWLTWHSRSVSRGVMAATFVATLFLPLQTAILLGVALSIAIYLYESSGLEMRCLAPNADGGFREIPVNEGLQDRPAIVVLNVRGDMYFGAVDQLEQQVEELLTQKVRVVVLRLRGARLLASSGVGTLQRIATRAKAMGCTLIVTGVSRHEMSVFDSSGLTALIGAEQIFVAQPTLLASTQQAIAHAQQLLLEHD